MLLETAAVLAILALQGAAGAVSEAPTPLSREAAEMYLRTSEVVRLEEYDNRGITRPRKAVLSDGAHSLNAVFKDIDVTTPKTRTADGRTVFNLKDSYKHEIAAYELDKLLEIGIVPPTVERRIGRETGSLQFWIEGAMTEWQRKRVHQLTPPDVEAWNNQISTLKLFLQLIWDTDYNNISNILVDPDWKLWKIDSSRAFIATGKLRREASLNRFSRRLLRALDELDRAELESTLGPWLSRSQIAKLWQRQSRIVELAEERVTEFGEAAVLYD